MSRPRLSVLAAAVAAVTVACAGPTADPMAARPYLVAVEAEDGVPSGTVSGTLVVEQDCVMIEDDGGLLQPLFAARTVFGPLDGGRHTIDVAGERFRIGDEVAFEGGPVEVTNDLRSRYPGVDLTRCGAARVALVGQPR